MHTVCVCVHLTSTRKPTPLGEVETTVPTPCWRRSEPRSRTCVPRPGGGRPAHPWNDTTAHVTGGSSHTQAPPQQRKRTEGTHQPLHTRTQWQPPRMAHGAPCTTAQHMHGHSARECLLKTEGYGLQMDITLSQPDPVAARYPHSSIPAAYQSHWQESADGGCPVDGGGRAVGAGDARIRTRRGQPAWAGQGAAARQPHDGFQSPPRGSVLSGTHSLSTGTQERRDGARLPINSSTHALAWAGRFSLLDTRAQ